LPSIAARQRIWWALALVTLASACGPKAAETSNTLTVRGRVLTGGPCRGGVPNLPVSVLGQGLRALSGADGAFVLTDVRPPFDLVVTTPSGPVVYLNAATTMPKPPGVMEVTIDTDVAGPEPKPLAKFTAKVGEDSCSPSPQKALSFPEGLEDVRFSLTRTGNTFVGTLLGCETVDALGDRLYLNTYQELSVDSGSDCQATIDVTTPWGFGLNLPLAPSLPDVQMRLIPAARSVAATVKAPSEGNLKVTFLDPFDSVELPVDADRRVYFPSTKATVEVLNASVAGLAVASYVAEFTYADVLETPAIPLAVSPVEGFSALAPGTEFLWTNTIKGVRLLTIERVRAGGPKFTFFTDGTSMVLPDLTAIGATFEPHTEYKWTVYTHQGWGSSLDGYLMNSFPQQLFSGPINETLTGARTIRTP